MTMLEPLSRVILRDLDALRQELRAYDREEDIWGCPPGITNSAGTLVLHLAGNLQHFIGATLGNTGYVRDRQAEFTDRAVPVGELEVRIDQTIDAVRSTLTRLDEQSLAREYPVEAGGARLSTRLFLTHLSTHLAYHLGQIDYHRRMVTQKETGAGAQSIRELTRD
jgi:uncharacterized damage-inducible protein DinB